MSRSIYLLLGVGNVIVGGAGLIVGNIELAGGNLLIALAMFSFAGRA